MKRKPDDASPVMMLICSLVMALLALTIEWLLLIFVPGLPWFVTSVASNTVTLFGLGTWAFSNSGES